MNKLIFENKTIMAESEAAVQKNPRKRKRSLLSDSEKKRRETHRRVAMQQTRIYLGSESVRWAALKSERNVKTDRELVTFLIDHFRSTTCIDTESMPALAVPGPSGIQRFSTPKQGTGPEARGTPSVSEVSGPESELEQQQQQRHMSGTEELPSSSDTSVNINKLKVSKQGMTTSVSQKGRKTDLKKLSASFVDPFDLSVDISKAESVTDEDLSDPDYEPTFDLSIEAVLPDEIDQMAEDVAFEEAEFGLERDTDTVDETNAPEDEPSVGGIFRVKTVQQCHELSQSTKCLVHLSQIRVLAGMNVKHCSTDKCSKPVTPQESFVGSALYLRWTCSDGHVSESWCSQPVLNKRLHSGDFLVCATILLSGNNYSKMALWANMLHLRFPSADQYNRIQTTYLVPTIDTFWANHQRDVIQTFTDQQLVVMGDGRNDTPGHCAQYCSYTLMDNDTKTILTIHTLDKRMTDRKSGNMEKAGFVDAMEELKEKGLNVVEVVTDAHLGIGAVMKTKYPEVKHSHDIWHVAKNLGKKLVKVAQKKQNSILLKWSRDIINHFWFACKTAESYNEFVCIWKGVLHHITNTHEWYLGHDGGVNRCLHELLSTEDREKPWLDPSEHAAVLKDLTAVVLDKRMLSKVGYYLNFRSTADLESFHQHILMYCAKRYAYTPPVYRARNILAALDHNMNLSRAPLKNKNGTVRLHRVWNKKSGRWTVYEEKERKSYAYVDEVVEMALTRRISDKVGMRKRTMEAGDPRQISKHLAPVEPPPTKDIHAAIVSRFK